MLLSNIFSPARVTAAIPKSYENANAVFLDAQKWATGPESSPKP